MQKSLSMPKENKGIKTSAVLLNSMERRLITCIFVMAVVVVFFMAINFAWADGYTDEIKSVLDQMIGIVGTVFQAVGVILSIYAVGQLVLAFKNEDANSKSSASTLLVVGIALIAIPAIIDGLGLVDRIGG